VAAVDAVKLVEDGQVIGMGSGTTAELAIRELGRRVREEQLDIIGVPTSKRSEKIGIESGINMSSLDEHGSIDLTIDGADEVDPSLELIKGLGGALLREKMVAQATEREVIVVDESKLVEKLGTRVPLPVEVIQFSTQHLKRRLAALGCEPVLRLVGSVPFVTDNGNYIIDCSFSAIENPEMLDGEIKKVPGTVETGLFLGIADTVIVGSDTGTKTLNR